MVYQLLITHFIVILYDQNNNYIMLYYRVSVPVEHEYPTYGEMHGLILDFLFVHLLAFVGLQYAVKYIPPI